MDLVTVACTRDKKLLELQAHSIDRFIEDTCTHWILIEDQNTSIDEWHALLNPYYKKHQLKIINNAIDQKYYNDTFITTDPL